MIDVALLDVFLRDQRSDPVAEILRQRGVPYVLATGYNNPEGAELAEEVTERALSALRRIAAANRGGEVLVVTHAGLLRTLRRALGADDVRFTNLGGCWFDVHDDGRVTPGDVVHLIEPQSFGDTL